MMNVKVNQSGVRDVKFGVGCIVYEPVNLYECVLGDGCMIGPFVEIQNDVMVGNRCRIQSHSFICSLVTIGDDCFISHGVMFVNDKFKGTGWSKTRVGNRVKIGSNATVLPVNICDDVVIGSGAVVTTDIVEPGVYVGNPARRLR